MYLSKFIQFVIHTVIPHTYAHIQFNKLKNTKTTTTYDHMLQNTPKKIVFEIRLKFYYDHETYVIKSLIMFTNCIYYIIDRIYYYSLSIVCL